MTSPIVAAKGLAMFIALLAIAAQPTVEEARSHLADRTTNPSAVQFRNVRVVREVVCGEINRPNHSGGYDGFERFMFRSPEEWVSGYVGHHSIMNGRGYVSTSRLFDSGMRTGHRTAEDIREGTRLLQEFSAAEEQALALLALCH